MVESTAVWPQGLLDAHVAMIPKADGDSTPLGQRPLCVILVVYRLWASLRLSLSKNSVKGWVPESVFSVGSRVSSGNAWLSLRRSLYVLVADVVKSFDTVDGSILDCALGRPGLPHWFRRVHFSFHSQVRLKFKLAAGLGSPWCTDGGIPQVCPLSMFFLMVALYVPWCWRLEVSPLRLGRSNMRTNSSAVLVALWLSL